MPIGCLCFGRLLVLRGMSRLFERGRSMTDLALVSTDRAELAQVGFLDNLASA